MKRIGILSDTHGYLDARLKELFQDMDEIWHAGDIGDIKIINELGKTKLVRAVYGNIDTTETRHKLKEIERFMCENVEVVMMHIGGYPNKYSTAMKKEMEQRAPQIQISGHSHILKVMFDKKYNCLHINPGAAGRSGFHEVRTAIRLTIEGHNIKDLEVIELGKRI